MGVEFLFRPPAKRDKSLSSAPDSGTPSPSRSKLPGKIPPGARVARDIASGANLPAAELDRHEFSAEESMAELRELTASAGATVAGEILQRRQKPDPATLIGSGKLEELKGAVASTAPDLVIFDHELTPSQQRNLERELDVRILDRTQLILDIFARHARTREGQTAGGTGAIAVSAASTGRTRHPDVATRRRHRHPWSR